MTASDVKICWVCHSSENGDNSNAWINPCKCKGSVKWCHQACLRPWIQYKIDNRRAVQCDICNYRYKILFPPAPANTIDCYLLCFAMYAFQYFLLSKRVESGVAFSYRDVLVWIVATFMVTGVIAMTMVFLGRARAAQSSGSTGRQGVVFLGFHIDGLHSQNPQRHPGTILGF